MRARSGSDPKKKPAGFDWLDPIVFTNLMITGMCKSAAALIAIAVRIITTIILAIVRWRRRTNVTRW